MTLAFIVLLCLLPPAVHVAYSTATGTISRTRAFSAVFAGLGAVFLASVLQLLLDPVTSSLSGVPALVFSSFAEAALVEELSKFALIAAGCAIARPPEGLSARAVLSVALAVGLSFSAFETLSYALGASSFPWIRLVTALPVHAAAAVCAGALVASVFRDRAAAHTAAFVGSFALAVALHGAYTASLSLEVPAIAPAFAFMCALIVLAARSYRATVK